MTGSGTVTVQTMLCRKTERCPGLIQGCQNSEAIAAMLSRPGGAPRGVFWSSTGSHHRARTSLESLSSPSAMRNWAEVTKAMTEKTGEPKQIYKLFIVA